MICNGFGVDGFHPLHAIFLKQHYRAATATGKVAVLSENKPVNQYNLSGLVARALDFTFLIGDGLL